MAKDKLLHIGLGIIWLAASAVSFWVLVLFGTGPFLAYHTTVYALLYEINQLIRKEGQPDPWDAFATALPGFVAWGVLTLNN
jgi:hypothetical protein